MYLDEHLGSRSKFRLFDRCAVGAHGLAITRELEREFLLPHGLDVLIAHSAQLLLGNTGLVDAVDVHLLTENRQCRLRRLTDLLVY